MAMADYIIKKAVRNKYGSWTDKWIAKVHSKEEAVELVNELRFASNTQIYSYSKI